MIGALIGGLISGAGSLLSGLGAKKSAEEQEARQRMYDEQARERVKEVTNEYRENVPKWMISDAAKAGFNPVTWLNAGALGWYGTQLSGLTSSYGNATQAINIPSSMSAMGGAISSFSGAFQQASQFSQKMDLEYASLDSQREIAAWKYGGGRGAAAPGADSLYLMSGAGGPVYKAGTQAGVQIGGGVTTASAGLSSSRPSQMSDWMRGYEPFINSTPDKGNAPAKIWGWLDPHPSYPAANTMEDQYGEVGGSVYGFAKAAADLGWTVGKTDAGMRFKKQAGELTNFFATRRPSDIVRDAVKPFFANPGNVPHVGMGM